MSGTTRWIAVFASAAILALAIAACGGGGGSEHQRRKQRRRGNVVEQRTLRRNRRRRLERPAGRPGSLDRRLRERKLGRHDLLRPGRLGWRPRTVHRRRHRLRRHRRAALRPTKANSARRDEALRTRRTDRDPGLHLADRGHLQPPWRRRTAASTRKPWRRSSTRKSRAGTTRRSPKTTRASNCPAPGSPRSTAPTSRARRRTSPTTSPKRPRASGRTKSSGEWPVKGGEAASGTSGVVEAVTAGEGAIGYADASQAGELGIATIKVGSEYVGPTAEAAAKILEESPEDKELSEGQIRVRRSNSTARPKPKGPTRSCWSPTLMACTKYGSADEAATGQGLHRIRDQPRRAGSWPPKTPARPRSRTALTREITPGRGSDRNRNRPPWRRSTPRPMPVNCWRRRPEGAAAAVTGSSPTPR